MIERQYRLKYVADVMVCQLSRFRVGRGQLSLGHWCVILIAAVVPRRC